jgi:hypothetical protein
VFNPGSDLSLIHDGDVGGGDEYCESVPVSVAHIGERDYEEVEMEVIRHRTMDLERGGQGSRRQFRAFHTVLSRPAGLPGSFTD